MRRVRPEAHLVQDLARLLVAAGLDLGALEAGERAQRAQRQSGVQQQRHPRGEQRVAPEHRHEPRRPGRDGDPVGMLGVEDAQRAQVLLGALQERGQAAVAGVHHRVGQPPLTQALGGDGALHRLVAPVARGQLLPVQGRLHLQAAGPLPPGRHDDVHGQGRVGVRRPPVGVHPCATHVAEPGPLEPESGGAGVQPVLPTGLDPALLDLEEVREVGADSQRDRARDGLGREVPQHHVLPHAIAHVAVPQHQERAVRPPLARLGPGYERGGEGLGLHRGQRLRECVVDQQPPARQQSGVTEEQSVRLVGVDVPRATAHAETCSLDEGDGPARGTQCRGLTGERPADRHGQHRPRTRTVADVVDTCDAVTMAVVPSCRGAEAHPATADGVGSVADVRGVLGPSSVARPERVRSRAADLSA